ncbi:hypothetical protein L9F63_018239, partial [Diploptera punctata]
TNIINEIMIFVDSICLMAWLTLNWRDLLLKYVRLVTMITSNKSKHYEHESYEEHYDMIKKLN